MNGSYSLVLDAGTTGVKALVFDRRFNLLAKSYFRLSKSAPKRGWVEQSPQELLTKSIAALEAAVREAKAPLINFSGLGITNQRETTILWDKKTGKPVYPAIVWQDARTARRCRGLQGQFGKTIQSRTGLKATPYFSASKIEWILNNVPQAKKLLNKDRLLFGTVDTWLLWNVTQEQTHATDYTNASRTLLFNIKKLVWDTTLLDLFGVPESILPEVFNSKYHYGHLKPNILGVPLPVTAVCGDQQASMFAAGTAAGATKVTYGTGTFVMQSVGARFRTREPFFTTLIPRKTKPVYALEARIDCCGKRVDALLAKGRSLKPIIREVASQVDVHLKQLPFRPKEMIVDGGLAQAPELATIQSGISGIPVKTQKVFDGTALGVAKLIQS